MTIRPTTSRGGPKGQIPSILALTSRFLLPFLAFWIVLSAVFLPRGAGDPVRILVSTSFFAGLALAALCILNFYGRRYRHVETALRICALFLAIASVSVLAAAFDWQERLGVASLVLSSLVAVAITWFVRPRPQWRDNLEPSIAYAVGIAAGVMVAALVAGPDANASSLALAGLRLAICTVSAILLLGYGLFGRSTKEV